MRTASVIELTEEQRQRWTRSSTVSVRLARRAACGSHPARWVLQRMFGWRRIANFKAIQRLFKRFDQGTNQRVFGRLWRDVFRQLDIDRVTLDLDSTVMTRYGEQAGAARGYNPSKRGRRSHHPIMAFVADTQMVANVWLRPGNAGSANNACAFLADSLERLGGKRIELLRADAGFSHASFLATLDSQGSITSLHSRCTSRFSVQAGYITHEGRKRILKLATAMRKREWISGLQTQSKRFDLPVIFTPVFVHEQVP